jgi:hypothetical protein
MYFSELREAPLGPLLSLPPLSCAYLRIPPFLNRKQLQDIDLDLDIRRADDFHSGCFALAFLVE